MQKNYDVIIIGAGLSGLAASHYLHKAWPGVASLVLEKTDRAGGAVKSFQTNGYLAEWGPHGFLNNTPETMELLEDTGLINKAQFAPLGDFVRYLSHKGKLEQLPQSPKQLLSTPLLGLMDKVRLIGDLFIKPVANDQTIGQWAEHRFGKGVLHLVDAAVSGTFAGDYQRLSIDAVMPGLRKNELQYGSVLRSLKAKKKLAGSSEKSLPSMVSFPNGMEQFITTLKEKTNIQYDTSVTSLQHKDNVWEVECGRQKMNATNVIIALPINTALKLLSPLATPPVPAAPEAKIINVVMGFGKSAIIPYGFGYLAPERENRFTMGAMFSTHMFPGRSPAGHVLIEALVGGRRHPERLQLDDQELIDKVYKDVSQLLTLPHRPEFVTVLRPAGGIPQLEMDHMRLLSWRKEICHQQSNLALCGFGWDGIGMNEMAKSAKQAVRDIHGQTERKEQDIKPVYF